MNTNTTGKMQYSIVQANSTDVLDFEVTALLQEGWQVVGGLTALMMDYRPCFYQAVIRPPAPAGEVVPAN